MPKKSGKSKKKKKCFDVDEKGKKSNSKKV